MFSYIFLFMNSSYFWLYLHMAMIVNHLGTEAWKYPIWNIKLSSVSFSSFYQEPVLTKF